MRKLILAIAATVLWSGTAHPAVPMQLAPLAFLLGEWVADGTGQPGVAGGGTEFTSDLQGSVMLRRNVADFPPVDGRPGVHHEDLMVIYVGQDETPHADYHDSAGNAIHYAITVPAAGQAVFLGDLVPGRPRCRLSYRLADDGTVAGEFAIANASTPDSFNVYLEWISRKGSQKER